MHPISLTSTCACARTHTHTHRHTHAHTGQICARGLPHLRRNQGRVPRPSPCNCHGPRPSPCRCHVRAYVCLSASVCVCLCICRCHVPACVCVGHASYAFCPSGRLSTCAFLWCVCVCVCVRARAACPRLPSLSQSPCHLAIAPQRPSPATYPLCCALLHLIAAYCTLFSLIAPCCGR